MDSNYLKKKLALDKRKKIRNDRMLKIFLVFFVVGYVFFFSSTYIFPKMYRNLDITDVGQTINMEDYIFTLDAWDYAEDDNTFEIILEVENLTLESKPKYDFVCKKNDNVYNTKIYKRIGNKFIIRVYGISRWADVSLNIEAGNKSATIYMDDKSVNKIGSLKERTNEEYEVYIVESKIKGMEHHLKRLDAKKNELDKKMRLAYTKLDKLEKEKKFQTKEEKKVTDDNKSKLGTELGQLKQQLDDVMEEIKEYNNKIKLQKKILDEMT